MKDIIEIVKSLEKSSLLPEGVSETIQNEAKEQRGEFLSMLLGTLRASLLGDILTGKRINRAGEGHGQGIVRAGYWSSSRSKKNKLNFLFPVHPLTSIGIKRHYQNKPRFINVYSRDNLPNKRKNRAYIINIDEYSDIRTHWIALYILIIMLLILIVLE